MFDPPNSLEADISTLRMRALSSFRSEREDGEIIEARTALCPTGSHASSLRPKRLSAHGYPPGCPSFVNTSHASFRKRFKRNTSRAVATDSACHAFGSSKRLNQHCSPPDVVFAARLNSLVEQITASSLAIKHFYSELVGSCGAPVSKHARFNFEIIDLLQSVVAGISHLENDIKLCRQVCASCSKQRVSQEAPHICKKVSTFII